MKQRLVHSKVSFSKYILQADLLATDSPYVHSRLVHTLVSIRKKSIKVTLTKITTKWGNKFAKIQKAGDFGLSLQFGLGPR